jgi:uncharacterized membrane protein YkvA (DUF1232 family)
MTVLGSSAFRRALREAVALVADNRPLGRLVGSVAAYLGKRRNRSRGVWEDVRVLLRLMRELAAGHYRRLPRRSLVAMLAAFLYFVDPVDLIPDLLPVVGLVDDAVVFAWVIRQIRGDLDDFRAWESEWGGAIDVDGEAVDPVQGALPAGSSSN